MTRQRAARGPDPAMTPGDGVAPGASSCTLGYHDELVQDPARWAVETLARGGGLQGQYMDGREYRDCRRCGSTLTRPQFDDGRPRRVLVPVETLKMMIDSARAWKADADKAQREKGDLYEIGMLRAAVAGMTRELEHAIATSDLEEP